MLLTWEDFEDTKGQGVSILNTKIDHDLSCLLDDPELGKRVSPRLRELASPAAARGNQKAGFPQPKDHSFVQPCTLPCMQGVK